jgi:hypothetical protein
VCVFVDELWLLRGLFFYVDNLAIVHAGDSVGVGKNSAIVSDNDHGPLW